MLPFVIISSVLFITVWTWHFINIIYSFVSFFIFDTLFYKYLFNIFSSELLFFKFHFLQFVFGFPIYWSSFIFTMLSKSFVFTWSPIHNCKSITILSDFKFCLIEWVWCAYLVRGIIILKAIHPLLFHNDYNSLDIIIIFITVADFL